jgi:magnesium and cobalt transporter
MNDPQDDSESTERSLLERLTGAMRIQPRDREALVEVLRDAHGRGLFDADARLMLEGVLSVADTQVRDVMVPRSQMVVVERDAPLADVLKTVVESGHSRFPVIGDDKDEVTGIVLAKDLLRHFAEDRDGEFTVREYLRPAIFVPESKRLNVLLKDFRANRNHMAIVVDEYGGVAGLVTIEDLLEQIVGEIGDEHDVDEGEAIQQLADNRYAVRAVTPVADFNEYFGADFSDEEFDTLGGIVIGALGRLPRRGERTQIGRFQFKVLRADNRRVHLLEVTTLADGGR